MDADDTAVADVVESVFDMAQDSKADDECAEVGEKCREENFEGCFVEILKRQ